MGRTQFLSPVRLPVALSALSAVQVPVMGQGPSRTLEFWVLVKERNVCCHMKNDHINKIIHPRYGNFNKNPDSRGFVQGLMGFVGCRASWV